MSNVLRWYYICENLYLRSRNSFFVINPNFGIYKMNVITNYIFQFIFWLVIRYLHDLIRIIFPIRNCKFAIFMENSSSSARLFHFQNAYRERIAFNRPAKMMDRLSSSFFLGQRVKTFSAKNSKTRKNWALKIKRRLENVSKAFYFQPHLIIRYLSWQPFCATIKSSRTTVAIEKSNRSNSILTIHDAPWLF